MARKNKRAPARRMPDETPVSEEQLQGPPPQSAAAEQSDAERRQGQELASYHATSPKLSGGDLDADWQRAHIDGEEAVGGTVATPDQNVVDELGDALGVPRAPDEPVRGSAEILDKRDTKRGGQEG
jgi:Family of unknown function (DUF6335)